MVFVAEKHGCDKLEEEDKSAFVLPGTGTHQPPGGAATPSILITATKGARYGPTIERHNYLVGVWRSRGSA